MKSGCATKAFFVLERRALTAERRLQRLERATVEDRLDPKTAYDLLDNKLELAESLLKSNNVEK